MELYSCPISDADKAEKLIVLCKIRTQLSCCKHACQASGELQFCLCLKMIGQVLAENQMSLFWPVPCIFNSSLQQSHSILHSETDTPPQVTREVEQALKTLQNGKATIEDESVAEMLKNGGNVIADWLLEILQKCTGVQGTADIPNVMKGSRNHQERHRGKVLCNAMLTDWRRLESYIPFNNSVTGTEEAPAVCTPSRDTRPWPQKQLLCMVQTERKEEEARWDFFESET